MEIRTSEEAKENVLNYAKRLISLQLDKKVIDQDIKALKEEFKEEGVPVGVVNSLINVLKARKKMSDSEIFEREILLENLESDSEIDDGISRLNEKS